MKYEHIYTSTLLSNGFSSTHHCNVAKFVSTHDGVKVQDDGGRNPAGVAVIGKDDHLVLWPLVLEEVEALLNVADHDAVAGRKDVGDEVWNVLE